MTNFEKWTSKYNEIVNYIEKNHRNPSKHRAEDWFMINWLKHNRKLRNAGKLEPNRVELFQKLMAIVEENKRKNQYG